MKPEMTPGKWSGLLALILLLVTSALTAENYEYDDAGRLIRVTWDDQRSITYEYDAAGNIVSIITQGISSVEDRSAAEEVLPVLQASTRSGTGSVSMEILLPGRGTIVLSVVDQRGSEVAVITEGMVAGGRTLVEWNPTGQAGERLPSGQYFARLQLRDQNGALSEWICRFVLLR